MASHDVVRRMVAAVLVAGLLGAVGCAQPAATQSPVSTAAASSGRFAGTEDGCRQLLSQFLAPGADHLALTRTLQPTDADYAAAFDGTLAEKAEAYFHEVWRKPEGGVEAREGQTELRLRSAATADFKAANERARMFPEGWKRVAPLLKDGLIWYRFSFVKPGAASGMKYDGLTHVNGHWAIFPKPWRALK